MIVSQEKRKKYQWNFKNTNYPRNKCKSIYWLFVKDQGKVNLTNFKKYVDENLSLR